MLLLKVRYLCLYSCCVSQVLLCVFIKSWKAPKLCLYSLCLTFVISLGTASATFSTISTVSVSSSSTVYPEVQPSREQTSTHVRHPILVCSLGSSHYDCPH